MAFPNEIVGKFGWEKDQTSSQKHPYGTKMTLRDGRVFRYVECGGTAVAEGLVVQSEAVTAAHAQDLAVGTAAAGATTITLSGSLTITKNQYGDGYLFMNTGDNRYLYRVKSNTAVASATGCVITIDEEDGLQGTATASTETVGLIKNPYKDVIITPASGLQTAGIVGLTVADLTADYYGWVQTRGLAVAKIDAAATTGLGVSLQAPTNHNGQMELRTFEGEDYPSLGSVHSVAVTDNETHLIWLTIE